MKSKLLTPILTLCMGAMLSSFTLQKEIKHTIAPKPWTEEMGNHRVKIHVKKASEAVHINYMWRRHDLYPAKKRFVIVNAETQDTIRNIERMNITDEVCHIAFGPAKEGDYYFYYMPYEVQPGYGGYTKNYFSPEKKATDKKWRELAAKSKQEALILQEEARTQFDSFYPMEWVATDMEKRELISKSQDPYMIFTEDRKHSIRMQNNIPYRWIQSGAKKTFKGEAQKNEYYVFQVGVYASKQALNHVNIQFSDLKSDTHTLSSKSLTCFNTEGINSHGIPFKKEIHIPKGNVQAMWIGVDMAKNQSTGIYKGTATLTSENTPPQKVEIEIKVNNNTLKDRGDSELWRLSRLRWLNSTLGIDDTPVSPYKNIVSTQKNSYNATGKEIEYNAWGFPKQISTHNTSLLSGTMNFDIQEAGKKIAFTPQETQILKENSGVVERSTISQSSKGTLEVKSKLEFDGYIRYTVRFTPKENLNISDISLDIPYKKEVAQYTMGMNLPGCDTPKKHEGKWQKIEDSFWMGSAHAGLWVELRGASYNGPLLNLYKPTPPNTWDNHSQGGYKIESNDNTTHAIAYSGKRTLKKGESITYEFALLVTPVKELNPHSQFVDRYYHNGGAPKPSDTDLEAGVKLINVHHATYYNPFINYPFIATHELKGLVDEMHSKGVKVKIYYTIRELSNHIEEMWALRSLGNEILGKGNGGGYPWLREHLVTNYYPQWYDRMDGGDHVVDAAILTSTGDSRWYNYYIEGLKWLVKNMDIDGLYLDDVAYDREMLKRMRRVMDDVKPGCIIDLHSNTGFSRGPAKQYTEFFPYLNKLWFGESFQYNKMSPANWLVESSGIPFGLMGDMLQAGGNRWLGMVFGMTVRYPWLTEGVKSDPRPVWKIWDSFGIADSKVVGFWDANALVNTQNPNVKATAYVKHDKILIAIGNFSDTEQSATLSLNKEIGKIGSKMYLPKIKDFQEEKKIGLNKSIVIPPREGKIVILERK